MGVVELIALAMAIGGMERLVALLRQDPQDETARRRLERELRRHGAFFTPDVGVHLAQDTLVPDGRPYHRWMLVMDVLAPAFFTAKWSPRFGFVDVAESDYLASLKMQDGQRRPDHKRFVLLSDLKRFEAHRENGRQEYRAFLAALCMRARVQQAGLDLARQGRLFRRVIMEPRFEPIGTMRLEAWLRFQTTIDRAAARLAGQWHSSRRFVAVRTPRSSWLRSHDSIASAFTTRSVAPLVSADVAPVPQPGSLWSASFFQPWGSLWLSPESALDYPGEGVSEWYGVSPIVPRIRVNNPRGQGQPVYADRWLHDCLSSRFQRLTADAIDYVYTQESAEGEDPWEAWRNAARWELAELPLLVTAADYFGWVLINDPEFSLGEYLGLPDRVMEEGWRPEDDYLIDEVTQTIIDDALVNDYELVQSDVRDFVERQGHQGDYDF